ncbi:hypothetical protein D3C77_371730 [compost metagenome]
MDKGNALACHDDGGCQPVHASIIIFTCIFTTCNKLIPQGEIVMTLYIINSLLWFKCKPSKLFIVLNSTNNPTFNGIF